MSEASLKERTAKGLFWGAMNSGTTQVLNLVFGIVLARLLSPEAYGIVGVLAIFTAIAGDLQSAGFTQALINIHRPTARDYNSVFSFNVCMSLLMYMVLFLCAPFIASFFHQPCLTSVSRVVFLSFFVASLGIAHGGYMTKNMMNKEFAILGVLALVVSGTVGITLALLGFSYWALAWQQISYVAVANLGRYYYVKDWRPRLTFDFAPVRQMASFALKILVTRIVNTFSNNILTVIFGRLFPIRQVGNYSQAFKWDTMAHSLISNTVGQLAQTVLVEASPQPSPIERECPSLGRRKGEDALSLGEGRGEVLRAFRKMIRFTAFLSMPLMFGFALVAKEFILVTIGEKWLDCVPLLQVLCISGAFMPLYIMYQNLAISQGRSDIFMWLNLVQIVLQIAVILTFAQYGMFFMVTAYSAFQVLWLLPWHLYTGRLIRYRWLDAFKDVAPFAVVSILAMGLTYVLSQPIGNIYLLLPLRVLIAATLYYVALRLLGARIVRECEGFLRHLVAS